RFSFSTPIVYEFFRKFLTIVFHLFQKGFNGMSIVRGLQKCFNSENDFLAFVGCGYESYFIPEFVLFMGFSFGNTSGKRFVNAVNFVFISSFLVDYFRV